MDYELNPNAAKKADQFFSKIESSGKYLGIFTRAETITSEKGTKGIDLSFKADTGEAADYLTIWTHDKDGNELRGFNLVMAIMTCLRIKSLKATAGEVEKYDRESGQRVKKHAQLYRDLMDKPVGLLIQMEEYQKNKGGTGWKPSIFSAFDKDEFVASEILTKAIKPETLPKMVANLRDKPLKNSPQQQSAAPAKTGGGVFDDFADDIPF